MNDRCQMTKASRARNGDGMAKLKISRLFNAFQRYSSLFNAFKGVILKKFHTGGGMASKLFLRLGMERPLRTGSNRRAAEADGVGDVVEFFVADFFEALAFGGELFVYFDDFLGHLLVGFFLAANKREIRAG